jgi:hypothetical protein
MTHPTTPTTIRHRIIGVTMLMAFILYLDRICMGEIVKSVSFNHDLKLTDEQIGHVLGSFFFMYALFQVPAGWASDRFGARPMLTIYIVLWSLFTAMTGFVTGFAGLLVARLLCGVAEAGAYPTSMALIRKWIPLTGRAAWLCGGGANTTHHTASRSRNFHPSSKAMSSEFVAQRTQPRILSDKDVCRISRRRSLTKGGAHPSGGLIANHAFASCSVTSSR